MLTPSKVGQCHHTPENPAPVNPDGEVYRLSMAAGRRHQANQTHRPSQPMPSRITQPCKCPHREAAHALDLHRYRSERPTGDRQLIEIAKVLDDGDARPQESRMHGPRTARNIIDVEGIDADHHHALLLEAHCGSLCEEWMTLEVAVCSPMLRPTGMDKQRL